MFFPTGASRSIVAVVIVMAGFPTGAFASSIDECVAECSASSARCLKVNPPGGSNLSASFGKLFDLLGLPSGRIEPAKLMGAFSVQSDPCHRQVTTIKAGILSNAGGTCYLSQGINFPTKIVLTKIIIPRLLRGTISNNGNIYSLRFSKTMNSAILVIGNPLLSADWGGVITDVRFQKSGAVLRTEQAATSSCVNLVLGA